MIHILVGPKSKNSSRPRAGPKGWTQEWIRSRCECLSCIPLGTVLILQRLFPSLELLPPSLPLVLSLGSRNSNIGVSRRDGREERTKGRKKEMETRGRDVGENKENKEKGGEGREGG